MVSRWVLVLSITISLSVVIVFLSITRAHSAGLTSVMGFFTDISSETGKKDFEKAKEKALSDKDPWHAWQQLTANAPDDISDDVRGEYRKLASSLVLSAARKNNPEALVLVFSRDDVPAFRDSRAELYKQLLVLAEQSTGAQKDRKLLMVAGNVLQAGKWAIKDSLRAASFYARAWAAGEAKASASLYDIYEELKDPGSAYLWEIRCIGECFIDQEKTPVSVFLTSRQIQWIQKLAQDKTVITVNGLAARKELQ